MRWLAPVICGLVALAVTGAADDDLDKANKALRDKLDGKWVMEKWEIDGSPLPEEETRKWKMVHKGEELTLEMDGKVYAKGTHKIDATKKPAHEEFTYTDGPPLEKGKTYVGIFTVEGDNYKSCFVLKEKDKERPKDFETKEKSGYILVEWKREK